MEIFFKNNNIPILPQISNLRYENLFNVYKFVNDGKEFYYYNITNKLNIPQQVDKNALLSTTFDTTIPLPLASYKIYGTTSLWYIIYILNSNTSKPRFVVNAGEEIIYLRPEFLSNLIGSLNV
jgi:hypothetical protein